MNGLKILNIKQSEARPILMLIGYSFFMGLSIAFYFTATISDFLTHFDITILPYTYVLSGILGYLLWLIWSYLEKKVQFATRLMLGISFLVISVAIQGICIQYFYKEWISFVMLVWVRVFIFVNMVNFWGMAGKLFNMSQGKRLFGVVSVGTVISDIFGFFSIPFILLLGITNPGLIFIALTALLVCLIITFLITRIFKDKLREQIDIKEKPKAGVNNKTHLFKNKYQLYLFSLAILPMFGFYFVDYLFLDQVQIEFNHSAEALAGFMGIFFGVVAIFELIIKTSVFSRLINNFGLKAALLALPGILLITVSLTIAIGLVGGAFGFLFSMIAFIKLLEKVLRSGVNDPSFQILYQPIPSQDRLAFQSKMEGVPTALGNIMAGVLILVLVFFDLTDPILFNAIFFIVLVLWCYMTLTLQKEYRNVIVNHLPDSYDESKEGVLSVAYYTNSFFAQVGNKSQSAIFKILFIVRKIDFNHFLGLLQTLEKPTSERLRAIVDQFLYPRKRNVTTNQLENNGYSKYGVNQETLENCIHTDSLLKKVNSEDLAIKRPVKGLTKSKEKKDRYQKSIGEMLIDTHPNIVNRALNQIPKPLDQENASLLINALEKMHFSHFAYPILNEKNDFVEKALIKKLQQLEPGLWTDLNTQLLSLQIIKNLGNIGGEVSQNHLLKLLDFTTSEVRYFAVIALDKAGYVATEEDRSNIVQLIEKEVFFCTWLLACIQDLDHKTMENQSLIKCLKAEYKRATDKIFTLLSFIYPRNTIQQMKSNLKTESTEKHVLGIEMCEMILSDTLKSMMVPVFSNVPDAERLKLLKKEFPQQDLSNHDRLKDIVYHNFTTVNTWLKILATDILSKTLQTVPKEIFANLYIKNPVIKESSYLAIHAINKDRFQKRIAGESKEYKLHFDKLLGNDPLLGKKDSIFEMVSKIRCVPLFVRLHEVILIKLVIPMVKIDLSGSDLYAKEYGNAKYVHFLIGGSFRLLNETRNITTIFEKGDILGLYEDYNLREIHFEASHDAQMFAVEAEYFFRLVAVYDELFESLMVDDLFVD